MNLSLLCHLAEAVPSLSRLPVWLDLSAVPQLGFLLGLASVASTQLAILPPTAKPSPCLQVSYLTLPPFSFLSAFLAQSQVTSSSFNRLPVILSPRLESSEHGTKQSRPELAKVILKAGSAFSNFVPTFAPLWSTSLGVYSLLSH